MGRVHTTIVAVEKAISVTYSEVLFVAFGYTAYSKHAPCCHLWPVRLHNNLSHHLIIRMIFGGKNYLI